MKNALFYIFFVVVLLITWSAAVINEYQQITGVYVSTAGK